MKQYEAVIKVMEENGGYATLGLLNKEVLKVQGCIWKTKTPFASIRRIVQDDRFFFKIKPGLYALKTWKDQLPSEIKMGYEGKGKIKEEFDHTYYQGLLVEIGNLKQMVTFISSQDKNKLFLDKKLSDIAILTKIYDFGYPQIVQKAKTIDVIWFNKRKMPDSLFEIEHSTDFQNSLLKFVELQDFNTKMFIISDVKKKRQFLSKLQLDAFTPIRDHIKFMDYEQLSDWHSKTYGIVSIEKNIYH